MAERKAQAARYTVLIGLNYPPHGKAGAEEVRAEAGAVVDNLPPQSLAWLLAEGCVERFADTVAREEAEQTPPTEVQ